MSDPVGERELRLDSPSGPLDALWLGARQPRIQLVLAHGAGAGLRHTNMQNIAEAFAEVGISTLRFNFPFMQAGKRRVDPREVAQQTLVLAAQQAGSVSPVPLWLGGHSFGGRMASHLAADPTMMRQLNCQGLILCSFPLHPAGKPAIERAAHLPQIELPTLFLSGERDDLADADLLRQVVDGIPGNAHVHWLETANHSYMVLKRTRQNPLGVFEEMAGAADRFLSRLGL